MVKQLTHVCTECLQEFSGKDMRFAKIVKGDFITLYCKNCIEKLGITDFKTYIKPRKKKSEKTS